MADNPILNRVSGFAAQPVTRQMALLIGMAASVALTLEDVNLIAVGCPNALGHDKAGQQHRSCVSIARHTQTAYVARSRHNSFLRLSARR